jgi:predicted phosphate transport protein (TIGR00153 family)
MKREVLNYYDEFIEMAKYSVEITDILKDFILSYNYAEAKEKEKRIHGLENSADITQHRILNYIIKDFVPPIDRDDIITITRMLDDVVDAIDEIVINLDIYAVNELRPEIVSYMDLLETATSKMHELFLEFKNMKNYEKVKKIVVEINDIEEQGDKLYQSTTKDLYLNETNPIEVVRWTSIFNHLEDCFDSIEHIAESVDGAFMKNS